MFEYNPQEKTNQRKQPFSIKYIYILYNLENARA